MTDTATLRALPPRSRRTIRDRIITRAQGLAYRPAEPMVGRLLHQNEMTLMYGKWGTCKTFVAVGLACSLALGRNWGQHRVPSARHVVYVAAEGGTGIAWRIEAWCLANEVNPDEVWDNLSLIPEPISVLDDDDMSEIAELMAEHESGLLVLDTKRRVSEGSDENKNDEQTVILNRLANAARASRTTVLMIHHPRETGDRLAGATAWEGNSDMIIRLTRDKTANRITWNVEKSKESADSIDFGFVTAPHVFDPAEYKSKPPENGTLVIKPVGVVAPVVHTITRVRPLSDTASITFQELGWYGPANITDLAKRRNTDEPRPIGPPNEDIGWKVNPNTLRTQLRRLTQDGLVSKDTHGNHYVTQAGLDWVPEGAAPRYKTLRREIETLANSSELLAAHALAASQDDVVSTANGDSEELNQRGS